MLLNLNDFRYFVEVVDRNGFSSAARALEIPTSTMSYRIRQLEQCLGVALLARSSRNVSMTEAGAAFYEHAVGMLERAHDAETAIRQRISEPTGLVRFTASIATAKHAMPAMTAAFLAKHPKVQLEQHAENHFADLVTDRYDLAIRAHSEPLEGATLVQRPLANVPWHFFASPRYLADHGRLAEPADLTQHTALFMQRGDSELTWKLIDAAGESVKVVPRQTRMLAACTTSLKAAAGIDLGVLALPAYVCRDELSNGSLVRVLPDWLAARSTITALLTNRRGMLPAVRAFLDHLVVEFPKAVSLG